MIKDKLYIKQVKI